jgi:hypothetical protein
VDRIDFDSRLVQQQEEREQADASGGSKRAQ